MIKITKKIVGSQYEGMYLKALDIKFIKYNGPEIAYHTSWYSSAEDSIERESSSWRMSVFPQG